MPESAGRPDSNADTLPALYACHRCQRIGSIVTAIGHEYATGHVSERVSDAMAEAVRREWAVQGRSLIDGADQELPDV